ncbi:MAG TPA: sigma-70 family RNA polymerase sigma factor [Acidimicrobiales bacterium]|nr:sigma-70 family RNA polymerase sigma factor [Acidimicrobiales bacterium]
MPSDDELIGLVRAGQEEAFAELVDRYHRRLVRLAQSFGTGREVAEEVAQDTWIAVLRGAERFEGRSSVRTWLFRICLNRARSAAGRERRDPSLDPNDPAVDPHRFTTGGQWASPPADWTDAVDDRLVAAGLIGPLRAAIGGLPPLQQQVVTLRDVEGLSSEEVCEVLSISAANQRVLLHRGRSRVRSLVEPLAAHRVRGA